MKNAIVRARVLSALLFGALFLLAGCSANKTPAAAQDSPETRGREANPKMSAKALLPVVALGPCKSPPIEPQKNEAGNYGKIHFGHYEIELLKTVVCDPKGVAFQEAKGQVYFGGNADLLITSGQVSKASEQAVEVLVNRAPVVFAITQQTEACGASRVAVGEMATITSHVMDNAGTALSLRSSALAWSIGSGMGSPAHFNCKD